MIRRQVSLEWHVGEEEFPEISAVENTDADVAQNGARMLSHGEWRLAMHLLRGVALLLLALIFVTGGTLSQEQREQLRIRHGVEQALALEELAWKRNDRTLSNQLIDDAVDARWQREWRIYWAVDVAARREFGAYVQRVQPLDGAFADVTRVELVVNRPSVEWWISSPQREVRFYREVDGRWLRTLPGDAFWGEPRVLNTPHLRFEYRARDAATVEAIAEQVESIYVELHRVLELELPTDESITFVIAPDVVRQWAAYGDRMEFTSPLLSKVPARLSDADYLAQQLVSQLTYRTVNAAISQQRNPYQFRWERMVWALRGWLRTELLDQRTPWHDQAEALFREQRAGKLPLRLHDVSSWRRFDQPDQMEIMWQYAAAESITAYTVEQYGLVWLPVMVRGFGRYGNWAEYIPGVYDISVEEFEREWNRYLTTDLTADLGTN